VIAVTGATGFIGRHLCRYLSDQGHAVRALVRAPSRELAALPRLEQRVVEDFARFAGWAGALEGTRAVVHLAGFAHGRGGDAALRAVNVEATLRAAQGARGRFLYVSSAKVHGERGSFDESSPLAPGERYAVSKAAAEERLRAVPALRLTVLRPPLVYGPGVGANFLRLLQAIAHGVPLPLASVRNRRSFLYVGNLVHAIAACLEREASVGRTYLLADGPPVSTPALCREIGRALGRPARLFPFPPPLVPVRALVSSLEVSDRAIRAGLGWQPPFSLERALRETAAWYRTR
jgi:nucleoside-diphosphate-sugar epimerase